MDTSGDNLLLTTVTTAATNAEPSPNEPLKTSAPAKMSYSSVKSIPSSSVLSMFESKAGAAKQKNNLIGNNDNLNKELKSEVDGTYAWFILACVFILNTTTLGALKVHGLIYERIVRLNYYNREDASWPIATASTIQNFAGLLTPTLTKFMSWRLVELIQTSMFVMSNLGAYFSENLYLDILCLGILQGIAFSLRYNMNIVINNEYFDRYRTTAMGISMAGATCGVFFLSPLVGYALDLNHNQFRPAYLALALLMATNYVFNVFIRRPKSLPIIQHETRSSSSPAPSSSSTITSSSSAEINTSSSFRFKDNSITPADGQQQQTQQRLTTTTTTKFRNDSENGIGIETATNEVVDESNRNWKDMALILMRNPFFHCIWMMQTIYFYISRTYTIILVDLAVDMGFEVKLARSILNYWVYGELLGRILLGPIVDLRILSIKYCTIVTCFMTATSSYLLIIDCSSWLHNVDNRFIWYCCLTMTVAAFSSLIAMLIVPFAQTYLKDRTLVPWAYAMGAFISSLFLLVRPMLIGLSRDTYHSYNLLIMIMASAALIFGLILFLVEPIITRRNTNTPD